MPATFESIATTTLGSAATSITVNSIPNTYTDLKVVLVGSTASNDIVYARVNGDTGSNYSRTYLGGNGATSGSGRDTNATRWQFHDFTATGVSAVFLAELDIFSYAGSTNKTALTRFSGDRNGAGDSFRNAVLWRNTSAITSVTLLTGGGNFEIGTTLTVYGIKAA